MSDLKQNTTLNCEEYTFSLWIHFPVWTGIALLCLLGNVPLFWMYATTFKTLKDKLFEVSLAVVDVIACTLLLGAMTFIQGHLITCTSVINTAVVSLAMVCLYTYSYLCFSIATARFVAVFFPTIYKPRKFQMTIIFVVASFLLGTVTTLPGQGFGRAKGFKNKALMQSIMFFIRLASVITTLSLYAAIFGRLWRSRKLATGVQSAVMALQQVVPNPAANGDQQNSVQKQVKKRAKHVLIGKIFAIITACFFLTATANALMAVWSWSKYWAYLGFINFVSNPPIYFWLNQDFRKNYISFWRRVRKKVRCSNEEEANTI